MSLQLKYTDENGILHINMSPPSSSPRARADANQNRADTKSDLDYPNFDSINKRFQHYDIFGGKYDVQFEGGEAAGGSDGESEARSLFRNRYNSVQEELANTPYAFSDRAFKSSTVRLNDDPILDITIESGLKGESPSKDLEDDRFFSRSRALNIQNEDSLFGPQVDFEVLSGSSAKSSEESPAFSVAQLIHAQDRYFDLSSKQSSIRTQSDPKSKVEHLKGKAPIRSEPKKVEFSRGGKTKSDLTRNSRKQSESVAPLSARVRPGQRAVRIVEGGRGRAAGEERGAGEAFRVLPAKAAKDLDRSAAPAHVIPISKRKRESSFAIIAETPSRPTSPRSLPTETRSGRTSPFRGRGFREETSRHTTPRPSRANSPLQRRASSLSRLDMAQVAAMPPPVSLSRPHSPRNYIKQNIEEVREISEFNREKNEAEAERRRREEEEALLREMGLLDKNANETGKSLRSRSNSPSKLKLRSRSNSPSAILHFENIAKESRDFVDPEDGARTGAAPVAHRSRVRSVSRSQPQSNDGSPKHSKIPKRQNSVSPSRPGNKIDKVLGSNLNKTQRFISNSTSSIHESVRAGGAAMGQRKSMSKSSHNISPSILKSKPPISPGKFGPPPTNKSVNPKRLSPIVGTPNKSPTEDSKSSSTRASPKISPHNKLPKMPIKANGNNSISRVTSKNTSKISSREQSPEKKSNSARNVKIDEKSTMNKNSKIKRTPSRPNIAKPTLSAKPDMKKAVARVNSIRNLTRTSSTKTLADRQDSMKNKDVKKDDKEQNRLNNVSENGSQKSANSANYNAAKTIDTDNPKESHATKAIEADSVDEKIKHDNETQYDKSSTNNNGEHLVPLTKMNVVSMTTAAITSQPLDVVTKVTNQLPVALEKAREKAMFERLGSNDSILGKNDESNSLGATLEKKSSKSSLVSIKEGDNIKLKPLQPPFNNPQVEKARQKIDNILKNPEISTENILNPITKEATTIKDSMKSIASTGKSEVEKVTAEIKDASNIGKIPDVKDYILKQGQKTTDDIRSEATKIVDSIMAPVEEPVKEKPKDEVKKTIEPVVMIVNEKPKPTPPIEVMEKMTEATIKGDPEVEVQSSNMKSPAVDKMAVQNNTVDGSGFDKSAYSNGGLPKSTSNTPRPIPPARSSKPTTSKEPKKDDPHNTDQKQAEDSDQKKPNLCQRLIGKCTNRSSCCGKKDQIEDQVKDEVKKEVGRLERGLEEGEKRTGVLGKFSCCKKKALEVVEEAAAERGAGKSNTIEFENESTKKKRGLAEALCGCCRRGRVGDSTGDVRRAPAGRGGCGRLACWRRKESQEEWAERRDSILSDRPQRACCNNRAWGWLCGVCCACGACGACGRKAPVEPPSRRTSMFSKNKSLSPTLPVEDTRSKLDTSLVEHTSAMRGAIPALPIALAYFCLVCNVLVPGLGTVFSGMLCLCFGVPRFGVHDGLKPRVGSLLINIAVGAAQLFTVLFCLVGWGWSIWWGTIMLKVARKYRKLRETAAADEERAAAPHVNANNHTAARA